MAAQYLKLLQKKMATKLDTATYSQDDMKYCQKKCSKESQQFEQNLKHAAMHQISPLYAYFALCDYLFWTIFMKFFNTVKVGGKCTQLM